MKQQWRTVGAIWAAGWALSVTAAQATVKPHRLFTDGAVLQQGIAVPVWGTAGEGEGVTVRFQDQAVTTMAKNGQWQVRLQPLRAGGPFTLTIQGENRVELKEILVGEVHVCSGQSNMEWPMSRTANAEEEMKKTSDPLLHLFTVPKAISDLPRYDVAGQWKACDPDTVTNFSAVAYYFGRDLRRALKVPVGLINASWGGTPAEAWTSRAMLRSVLELRPILDGYKQAKLNYVDATSAYQVSLRNRSSDASAAPVSAPHDPEDQNRPTGLYNAMLRPLQPYAIRGAIWYQGESNAGRAAQYQTLFPAMIRNWREDWGQGDFPFFFVQLAPFMKIQAEPGDSAWAELREAQRLTTLTVPQTGMAVITDAGEEDDIHPRRKEPVGARLALAARAVAYGDSVVASGPTYRSLRVSGREIELTFGNVGGGLVAQGGELKGFTIAGTDGKFVNAPAKIRGTKVIVSSPQVSQPVAVRFGWANYPVVNLFNKEGLPASPFRTDTFPLTTAPH